MEKSKYLENILLDFYKDIRQGGRLYNDKMSDEIMKRDIQYFIEDYNPIKYRHHIDIEDSGTEVN